LTKKKAPHPKAVGEKGKGTCLTIGKKAQGRVNYTGAKGEKGGETLSTEKTPTVKLEKST